MNEKYYLYCWFNDDWGHIPFYIGKGSGFRYKSITGRSRAFMAHVNRWKCHSEIFFDHLDESSAYKLEALIKNGFVNAGYPIIDGEAKYLRSYSQREGIEAKKQRGEWEDYGRPKKSPADFQKFLKKQKDGEITVGEAIRVLGISKTTWYARAKEMNQ